MHSGTGYKTKYLLMWENHFNCGKTMEKIIQLFLDRITCDWSGKTA